MRKKRTKNNLTSAKKTDSVYMRIDPNLKKEAKIYALENGFKTFSELVTKALIEKISK